MKTVNGGFLAFLRTKILKLESNDMRGAMNLRSLLSEAEFAAAFPSEHLPEVIDRINERIRKELGIRL